MWVKAVVFASILLVGAAALAAASRRFGPASRAAGRLRVPTRTFQSAVLVDEQAAAFSLLSAGTYCEPDAYLWSGKEPACDHKCSEDADCSYYTSYDDGFCQLVKTGGCDNPKFADNPSSKTYAKNLDAAKVPQASFQLLSTGTFCSPHAFLWSGSDAHCMEHCTAFPTCAYYTAYVGNSWCQLVRADGCGGADVQLADDKTAATYQRLSSEASQAQVQADADADRTSCAGPGEDCRSAACCQVQGMQCYEKDDSRATCQAACVSKGTGWSCKEIGLRSPRKTWASWPGEDCAVTRLCANPGTECYRKDVMTAYCTSAPGAGWSGEVIGSHRREVEAQPETNDGNVASGDSLFCFMAVLRGSAEDSLEAKARELRASIFSDACKANAVYDSSPAELTFEGNWHFMNADAFHSVWTKVREDGVYKGHEWTVKVDPDTVFVPDRLRGKLSALRAPRDRPVYVKSSDVDFGFFGAIEVMNRAAVDTMLGSLEDCKRSIGSHSGEYAFVKGCMDSLGVSFVKDASILVNPQEADCGDTNRVAFHPHKRVDDWAGCFAAISR